MSIYKPKIQDDVSSDETKDDGGTVVKDTPRGEGSDIVFRVLRWGRDDSIPDHPRSGIAGKR